MHPSIDPEGVYLIKILRLVSEKEAAVVEKRFNKVREFRKNNTNGRKPKKPGKNTSGLIPEDTGED
ncbi:MAG: hypothetical protein J6Y12_05590, partial [Lachnospiraceae bacterium]|nr:hypothetical protein [Lachnospiraceae bacterium]